MALGVVFTSLSVIASSVLCSAATAAAPTNVAVALAPWCWALVQRQCLIFAAKAVEMLLGSSTRRLKVLHNMYAGEYVL